MDNRTQVIYEEGIKNYKQKKFDIAASIFVSLAKNSSTNSSIDFFAGVSLLMIKKHSLAVTFFKKVIEFKENYQQTMKSCILLGYIYIKQHKYEDAFEVLKLPVEANFNDPYVYSLMGYLSHHNKKYKEADGYFKKCLDYDADSPLFNNNYGYNLLIWKKDFEGTVPYLKKAIYKKKTSAYLHSLGWALFFSEKYAESQKILSAALKAKKNKSVLIKKHLDMVKKKMEADTN